MIETLERSMHRLRQMQYEKDLRLKTLVALEDIAHWQLMERCQNLMDEISEYNLVKAGFTLNKAENWEMKGFLKEVLKAKSKKKKEDDDLDDDDDDDDSEDSEDKLMVNFPVTRNLNMNQRKILEFR